MRGDCLSNGSINERLAPSVIAVVSQMLGLLDEALYRYRWLDLATSMEA